MYKTGFTFYTTLKLRFCRVGAPWPPRRAESSLQSGLTCAGLLKFLSRPNSPSGEICVRSDRCTSSSFWAYNTLSFGGLSPGADWEKETNSVTVFMLKIDKCLFGIKDQFLH